MDQTAAPTQPPVPTARTVARPRPQSRARAGAGLLAAAVLMVGLSGCAVAEDGGEAASEAASSSSSQATDTSAEAGGQPVADTAVGNAARTALPSVVTISATSSSASGSGSGSILDTEGHILTNTHVVTLGGQANDAELTVRTSDGEVYAATVVGTDPLSDLAVIKIDAPDLTPIQIGRSGDLKVGDEAVAIGAPLGLPNTVTDGIISTLDRTIAVASSEAPEPQGESSGSSSGSDQYRFQLPGTPQGTRGDGTNYALDGIQGSWFKYAGNFQFAWQRDFFDFGNVSALFIEMLKDKAMSDGMLKRIEKSAPGDLPGWYPFGKAPVPFW